MAEGLRIEMRIAGGEKLKRLAKDLRDAGRKDLKKELLRELRAAGKPVVADVRRAVLATPSKNLPGGSTSHQGGKGLRMAIAKATGMSISVSGNARIRIRVNAKRVQPGTLPKYLDGELSRFSRWRSKTFTSSDTFADGSSAWKQQPSHPYFFSTVRAHRDDFRAACMEAMDTIADKLTAG